MVTVDRRSAPIRELLARLGPGRRRPAARPGWSRCCSSTTRRTRPRSLPGSSGSRTIPTRHVALPARQLLAHARENVGDPAGAVEAAVGALALVRDDEGPWTAALLHTHLADLTMNLGDTAAADEHARAALPVMQRLGATDDVLQLRALLVLCAIAEGRLADAEAELERVDAIDDRGTLFGGIAFRQIGAAELALARGDIADRAAPLPGVRGGAGGRCGCRGSSRPAWSRGACSASRSRSRRMPTTRRPTPTTPTPASCSPPAASASCACSTRRTRNSTTPSPAWRCSRLGAWGLLRDAAPVDDAVELLVLAERFAYNRMIPTMAWERIAPHAEARAPGRIAALRDELGDRRPPELLDQAHGLVEQLR